MEFLPSVSRSGGLGDDGDALKSHKLQEEYHDFIHKRLERYWLQYPPSTHLMGTMTPEQRNAQSNILILFRKLREGLMASKRVSDFSLQVYETSLYLAVLFRIPAQTTSILTQLFPQRIGDDGLYDKFTVDVGFRDFHLAKNQNSRDSVPDGAMPIVSQVYRTPHTKRGQARQPLPISVPIPASISLRSRSHISGSPNIVRHTYPLTWLLSLLHALLQSFPSRSVYYAQLNIRERLQRGSHMTVWLNSILVALQSRNYTRFEKLTRQSEVLSLCKTLTDVNPETDTGCLAISCLVVDLRAKVRECAWEVLRAAYRELDVSQSASWLQRVLMLHPGVVDLDPSGAEEIVQGWLGEKPETEVVRKEATHSEGLWVLYRRK